MIKKILMLLLIVVVVFLLGKNFFIKMGADLFVKAKTDMNLDLGKFKLGIFNSTVNIQNMALYNSSRFKKERMISIPEVFVNLSVAELFKGNLYINDLRFNLEELVVVKNKEGKINLSELKAFASKGDKKKKKPKKKAKKKKTKLFIENFELHVGNVIYKDYSVGEKPKIQVFKVGINKKLKNIDDLMQLSNLIVAEALARTAIAKLAEMDLGNVKAFSKETMKKGAKVTKEAIDKGAEASKQAIQKGKDTIKLLESQAEESLNKLLQMVPVK